MPLGHVIKGRQNIIDFLFGKKAKFTLKSMKTGVGIPFVSKNMIKYIAVYTQVKHIYLGALTKKYVGGEMQLSFKACEQYSCDAMWAFEWFARHFHEYDRIQIWHQGVCSHCGRVLTDPKSIERGIGPKCYEILRVEELPF